jgi:hypothetical protein
VNSIINDFQFTNFVGTCVCLLKLQVARKLAMVEADLERAEERAETGET